LGQSHARLGSSTRPSLSQSLLRGVPPRAGTQANPTRVAKRRAARQSQTGSVSSLRSGAKAQLTNRPLSRGAPLARGSATMRRHLSRRTMGWREANDHVPPRSHALQALHARASPCKLSSSCKTRTVPCFAAHPSRSARSYCCATRVFKATMRTTRTLEPRCPRSLQKCRPNSPKVSGRSRAFTFRVAFATRKAKIDDS